MPREIQVVSVDNSNGELVFRALRAINARFEDSLVNAFLGDPNSICLTAWQKDEFAGWITGYRLQRFREVQVLLYEIDVVDSFRQRGVATKLIEKLEESARRLGASEIWVLTAEDNTPAMGLYAKTGFQRERMNDVFWRLDLAGKVQGSIGTSLKKRKA